MIPLSFGLGGLGGLGTVQAIAIKSIALHTHRHWLGLGGLGGLGIFLNW